MLNNRYGPFDTDGAAEAHNALLPRWFGPGSPYGEDALAISWGPLRDDGDQLAPARVFVNPPYGRGLIVKFVKKARSEARDCRASTTLLLPATIETPWFHEFVWDNDTQRPRQGVELYLFKGRISFLRPDGSSSGSPGIGSMAVTFHMGLR